MTEPILVKNLRILLRRPGRVETGASILLEDGRITWIGEQPPPLSKTGYVIEGDTLIAAPCLYNAHTHSAMTLLRGYCDDYELSEWLQYMWAVEKHLTPRIVREASLLAAMEMASTGTCGFMDMYFYPGETARAAASLGLRARLGPVIMGDVDPYKAVEHSIYFAKSLKGLKNIGGVINVHSIYAAPLDAVTYAAEAARQHGLPMHIHVSETRREVYEAKKKYGLFPVELMAKKLNALNKYTVLVHAGWIASWEINLVAEAGASIVHCPTSNMKLATAGHMPAYELIEKGVNLALGTDGPASNNTLNMFLEMKQMILLQRHSYWDTRIKARHALQAATTGSARAMKLPRGCGTIEEGAPADLVLIDAEDPLIQPTRIDNIESTLVYAATGREVKYTIVAGKIVYDRQRDWERWRRRAAIIARDLNRFIERYAGEKSPTPPTPRTYEPPLTQ